MSELVEYPIKITLKDGSAYIVQHFSSTRDIALINDLATLQTYNNTAFYKLYKKKTYVKLDYQEIRLVEPGVEI